VGCHARALIFPEIHPWYPGAEIQHDGDLTVGVTRRKPKIKYTQTPSLQTISTLGFARHHVYNINKHNWLQIHPEYARDFVQLAQKSADFSQLQPKYKTRKPLIMFKHLWFAGLKSGLEVRCSMKPQSSVTEARSELSLESAVSNKRPTE